MRTIVAIFLLVLLVSIQTPVGQFLKFAMLSEHFIKHQKQDKVSLIAFLQDHYSSDHNDAGLPEDEQLPFKNISFFTIGYAIVTGLIKTQVLVSFATDKEVIFPDTYKPKQHSASIFHPPESTHNSIFLLRRLSQSFFNSKHIL
jgi:hypothetical protein